MRRALVLVCCVLAGCGATSAPSGGGAAAFSGRLLALSDTDMPGSAYADGRLEPLAGAVDTLTLLDPARRVLAAAPAPNSVLSWPQVLTVSPDGRFAYVVETRGAPPSGATRLETVQNLPRGSRLTAFRLDEDGVSLAAPPADAGLNPQSVSLSADGRWLAIVNESGGGTLVVFELPEGLPGRRFEFPLGLAYAPDDPEPLPRSLAWSPTGDWLAVNVALRRIAFFRLTRGSDGAPTGVVTHGRPVEVGKRLSRGLWTADGRYFLIPDINSREGALARVLGAPGVVTALAFDAGAAADHRIVSRARVGGSPEGISLSPDQRRVATVNLERTFLPDVWFLAPVPKRGRYTVDLLDFDPATGRLNARDRISAEGILPEDAVFDASSQALAVAVFHRQRGPDRRRGFIDYFAVANGELRAAGHSVALPRGVHDIEVLP